MNKTLKKVLWILLVLVIVSATIRGAFADDSGTSKVKLDIYNGSFKLTDRNGNSNEWDCDSRQELTYYYPANCPQPTCYCNATCPKDIITLNATCNKECPSIPKQNISCNQQCAECPEDDNSAFWMGFFFMFLIIIGETYVLIIKFKNEKKSVSKQTYTKPKPVIPILAPQPLQEFEDLN